MALDNALATGWRCLSMNRSLGYSDPLYAVRNPVYRARASWLLKGISWLGLAFFVMPYGIAD